MKSKGQKVLCMVPIIWGCKVRGYGIHALSYKIVVERLNLCLNMLLMMLGKPGNYVLILGPFVKLVEATVKMARK